MEINNQKIIVLGLVFFLFCIVMIAVTFFFKNHSDGSHQTTTPQKYSDFSVQVPIQTIQTATNISIAKRRGVCRTMNQHLVNYANAQDDTQAKTAYRGMSVLANEMMNYYQVDTSKDKALNGQTLADPKIWIDKEGFHSQRQKLTTILEQNSTNSNYQKSAIQIQIACQSCHQAFLKKEL